MAGFVHGVLGVMKNLLTDKRDGSFAQAPRQATVRSLATRRRAC
jgi:hypothetical protein